MPVLNCPRRTSIAPSRLSAAIDRGSIFRISRYADSASSNLPSFSSFSARAASCSIDCCGADIGNAVAENASPLKGNNASTVSRTARNVLANALAVDSLTFLETKLSLDIIDGDCSTLARLCWVRLRTRVQRCEGCSSRSSAFRAAANFGSASSAARNSRTASSFFASRSSARPRL